MLISLKKLHTAACLQREVLSLDANTWENIFCQYLIDLNNFSDSLERRNQKRPKVRPKHAWVCSYGRISKESGSVSLHNTQLGEQKNALIKSHSQSARQTKNVLLTICKREKVLASLRSAETPSLEYFKSERSTILNDMSEDLKRYLLLFHADKMANFVFSKRLRMCGETFRTDGKSCIMYGHPRRPSMGLIHGIATNNENLFFITQQVNYKVDVKTDLLIVEEILMNFSIINAEDLTCSRPVYLYETESGRSKMFWTIKLFIEH